MKQTLMQSFAEQSIEVYQDDGKQKQYSRSQVCNSVLGTLVCKPVTTSEMRTFLGVMFLTGIVVKPELQLYCSPAQ